ncbi:trypsin-like peptidase domain-containing protein [Magnetospirillum sp. SS-4]|uniref:trypsin-like peptidase domain-containing protein n=1 Tax=Magnetospirillum sp. SS-4 TaxID=2681465 RepID=UPI001383D36F|nr:trypsin-like peptidase domain-containing protein [Magnetospirillum sp. SS-4]CAA7617560.1 TPR repeat-containing protein [Magnetospirillum sp. SS-4]
MRIPAALCLSAFLLVAASPAFAGLEEGLAAFQRKDWTAAARELQPLADKGISSAQAHLGHMLFYGLGMERNDAEALKLLRAAADSGDPMAQNALGNAYFLGRAVPKDPTQALVWFGRAAAQDYPQSNHALGEIHFNGLGVGKDEAKGIEYYRFAAGKGLAVSQEKLADLSWNGRAMPADKSKALEYAHPAAAANRPIAQFILGVALATGTATGKNPVEAAGWFRRAADQGHPQSQHNLGVMYANGAGIAKNPVEAYFWMALAAQRAPASLKATYDKDRDTAAAKLSPSEQDQVRRRLAGWQPVQPGASSGSGGASPPHPVATAPASPQSQPPATRSDPITAPPETSSKKVRTSTGSGIIVSRDGMVLTNAHVVEQCRTITVKPAEGPPIIASLAAKDAGNDMALLKTSIRGGDIARFREDRPLRSGDEVVVVGFPLSSLLSREANVTSGVISAMAGLHGDTRHYQITAPVQKGNSGGPLVDTSGNVIGIVTSKLNAMKIAGQFGDLPQNINFAIKSDLARKFLGTYSVAYETSAAQAQLSAADVGERIKRVTVFIECKVN